MKLIVYIVYITFTISISYCLFKNTSNVYLFMENSRNKSLKVIFWIKINMDSLISC